MTKKTRDEAEKSKEARGMMGGFPLYESKGGRGLSGREDPPLLGRLLGRKREKKKKHGRMSKWKRRRRSIRRRRTERSGKQLNNLLA